MKNKKNIYIYFFFGGGGGVVAWVRGGGRVGGVRVDGNKVP